MKTARRTVPTARQQGRPSADGSINTVSAIAVALPVVAADSATDVAVGRRSEFFEQQYQRLSAGRTKLKRFGLDECSCRSFLWSRL